MANQPIPVVTANEMRTAFIEYMTNLNVDMQQQTQSVGFGSADLLQWMGDVATYADEFKIFLGVYTAGEHEGRITTIIWPYKDGQPALDEGQNEIEPFNEGTGTP